MPPESYKKEAEAQTVLKTWKFNSEIWEKWGATYGRNGCVWGVEDLEECELEHDGHLLGVERLVPQHAVLDHRHGERGWVGQRPSA